MNNTNITGTKFTPYLLNLGYYPCVYPGVEWSTPPVDSVTSSPAKNVAKTLKKQWKIAHKIRQDHKDAVNEYVNRSQHQSDFSVDDQFLINMLPAQKKSQSAKPEMKFETVLGRTLHHCSSSDT